MSPYRRPRIGSRLGPYELRGQLGAGTVYRAYDTRHGRMVALKLSRCKTDPGLRERWRREARLVAGLHEPHVLPVHDFGEIDGLPVIDMPLIEGGSLRDLLSARGALEAGPASAILAQVAAALDAAHAAGLVHGNVKPENILLTPDHHAYLSDFGVASVGGSCAYTAPEQFSGGPVGPEADVYSLACVLYECLSGQPPFDGADRQELIDAHLYWPPPRPSIMRRGVDKAFDAVVAQGMAKPPSARFASAGELARAANGMAPSTHQPAPPTRTRRFAAMYPNPDDTGQSPYPPPPPQPRARNPVFGHAPVVLGAAAALVLVVAAVIAAILAVGNHGSGAPSQTAAAPAPPASTATKTPSLSNPVQGADGLGFVGHSARCDAGNPPAAVVRTAQSLAVVCQTGPGNYYYRGERIRDGANIELSNAVPSSGGFDVTNPADGTRYEVRPQRLRIISNGHVDSSEPVLQYATAT